MSNLTDALIAAKLVGGSGGSGGGSGLPEITTETEEILAEQSVTFSSQGGAYAGRVSGQYPINVGDNLTVTWDGVSYDCVASDVEGFSALGNLSIVGMGADTGEPFVMAFSPGEGVEMYATSGGVHTVSVSKGVQSPADGSIMQVVNGAWQPVVPPSGGTNPLLITLNENDEVDITYNQWWNALRSASNIVIYDESNHEYYPVVAPNDSEPPMIMGMRFEWDSAGGGAISVYALNIYTNSSEESDDEIISVDSVERSGQLIISTT